MRTVASFRDGPSAHIARSLLDAEGIPYRIVDEHTVGVHWLVSDAVGGVKLQVPAAFEARARDLLARDLSREVESEAGEACPACRSHRVGPSQLRRRVAAFGMIFGLPLVAWSRRWRCRSCGHRWMPEAPDRAPVIALRRMAHAELARIGEVDRSEHVTEEYAYRGGCLERRSVDVAVPPWSPSGDHEHSVAGRIAAWRPILDRGGTLVGAFEGDRLVGFAIHRPRLAEGTANLSALFVSRSHRRKGVARRLVAEVARLARAEGARRLYVSATPSVATVEFYRSQGFAPTGEPNAELFALEPDDIHMIREL